MTKLIFSLPKGDYMWLQFDLQQTILMHKAFYGQWVWRFVKNINPFNTIHSIRDGLNLFPGHLSWIWLFSSALAVKGHLQISRHDIKLHVISVIWMEHFRGQPNMKKKQKKKRKTIIQGYNSFMMLYRAWHKMLHNLQKWNSNWYKSHIQANQMMFA